MVMKLFHPEEVDMQARERIDRQEPGPVTIRIAGPADARALRALEDLDSGRLPAGDVVVAEVAQEIWAAVPVAGGAAVADPFHPSAALVELLVVHAAQLRSGARRSEVRVRGSLAVATR